MAYKLRNPHLINLHLSICREFAIREHVRFKLQGDACNATNTVRFGGINTSITNAAFSRVTSQANVPRAVQLRARIRF